MGGPIGAALKESLDSGPSLAAQLQAVDDADQVVIETPKAGVHETPEMWLLKEGKAISAGNLASPLAIEPGGSLLAREGHLSIGPASREDRFGTVEAKAIEQPGDYGAKVEEFRSERKRFGELDATTLSLEATKLRESIARGVSVKTALPRAFALADAAESKNPRSRAASDAEVKAAFLSFDGYQCKMGTGQGACKLRVMLLFAESLKGNSSTVCASDHYTKEYAKLDTPALKILGLGVGELDRHSSDEDKNRAYAADVTYVPEATHGFDQLAGRLAEHNKGYLLLDEIDSLLTGRMPNPEQSWLFSS